MLKGEKGGKNGLQKKKIYKKKKNSQDKKKEKEINFLRFPAGLKMFGKKRRKYLEVFEDLRIWFIKSWIFRVLNVCAYCTVFLVCFPYLFCKYVAWKIENYAFVKSLG